MAHLEIHVPGETLQSIPLGKDAIVIGRTEEADVFLLEKKSSRKHLRVAPLAGGGWVAEDLGSANGTRFGETRILRHLWKPGETLRIGDSTLKLIDDAPASAAGAASAGPVIQLGGSLAGVATRPVDASAPEPVQESSHASLPAASERRREPGSRRAAPAKSSRGAIGLVVVAVAALVGVELFLAPMARKAQDRQQERRDVLELLEAADEPVEEFAARIRRFELDHPQSTYTSELKEHLKYARRRDAHEKTTNEQLASLAGWPAGVSTSQLRLELLALLRERPEDDAFASRVERELRRLDDRKAREDTDAFDSLLHDVKLALGEEDPARAGRLLASFRHAHPGLDVESLDKLKPLQRDAENRARALCEKALADAEAAATPQEARAILAKAWPRLAGTEFGIKVAARLRTVRVPRGGETPAGPADAGTEPGTPGTAPEPGMGPVTDAVLAQAERAQSLVMARSWTEGHKLLTELLEKVPSGRMHEEWKRSQQDVERMLALTKALGERAASDTPPRPKLTGGRVTIVGANEESVSWRVGDGEPVRKRWSRVDDADVLTILSPRKPTLEQRLGLALVAADIGDRPGVVRVLAPLFEGEESAPEVAQVLVARRLYGRSKPPAGGYRHHGGDLLDAAGYKEAMAAERVIALKGTCAKLLADVAKQPAFKKLAKLAALRDELDKRRKYALLGIFNEKHYPYPANKAGEPYRSVDGEIHRRIARVKEIWDDTTSVTLSRKKTIGSLLDKWDAAIAELKELGHDTKKLEAEMRKWSTYVTGKPVTVRDYFRDAREAKHLAYCRWVMEMYNPARTEYATQNERDQVRITNEYRTMMGYMAQVRPGAAPFASIESGNVVEILDSGEVLQLTPLKAVRVDNRLMASSRDHSLDMQTRGYFSHHSKPNPATGQGSTAPHQRIAAAGYRGFGSGENIANGATNPGRAHQMWIHSSGHHRNILSNWRDMGSGQAGRLWTQNFASGGGAPTKIYDDTELHLPEPRAPRNR